MSSKSTKACSLHLLSTDVFRDITSLLNGSDVTILWLCGDKALNYRLGEGGGVRQFNLKVGDMSVLIWPQLPTLLPHLVEFSLYNYTLNVGSITMHPKDLLGLPKTLKKLRLAFPHCWRSFLRVLVEEPRHFDSLEYLDIRVVDVNVGETETADLGRATLPQNLTTLLWSSIHQYLAFDNFPMPAKSCLALDRLPPGLTDLRLDNLPFDSRLIGEEILVRPDVLRQHVDDPTAVDTMLKMAFPSPDPTIALIKLPSSLTRLELGPSCSISSTLLLSSLHASSSFPSSTSSLAQSPPVSSSDSSLTTSPRESSLALRTSNLVTLEITLSGDLRTYEAQTQLIPRSVTDLRLRTTSGGTGFWTSLLPHFPPGLLRFNPNEKFFCSMPMCRDLPRALLTLEGLNLHSATKEALESLPPRLSLQNTILIGLGLLPHLKQPPTSVFIRSENIGESPLPTSITKLNCSGGSRVPFSSSFFPTQLQPLIHLKSLRIDADDQGFIVDEHSLACIPAGLTKLSLLIPNLAYSPAFFAALPRGLTSAQLISTAEFTLTEKDARELPKLEHLDIRNYGKSCNLKASWFSHLPSSITRLTVCMPIIDTVGNLAKACPRLRGLWLNAGENWVANFDEVLPSLPTSLHSLSFTAPFEMEPIEISSEKLRKLPPYLQKLTLANPFSTKISENTHLLPVSLRFFNYRGAEDFGPRTRAAASPSSASTIRNE